jgi:hypothetical protein
MELEDIMDAILDFDRTLTGKHTFPATQLIEQCPISYNEKEYLKGISHATFNLKSGSKEYFKHDDSEHISAIATFHNNHSYIAGYISVLLGGRLTLKETHFSERGLSASAIYQIDGIKKPLIISYIPATGDLFNTYITALGNNKNQQINHIRQLWCQLELAQEETPVSFYDDNAHNCMHAQSIPYIKVYKVNPDNPLRFECKQLIMDSSMSASSSDSIVLTIESENDTPVRKKTGFFSKKTLPDQTARIAVKAQVKQYVFEDQHELVEESIRAKRCSLEFIAGFYAEAGNHEMAEMYLKQSPKALAYVIQGYALEGYHDQIKHYFEQGMVTSDYIASCYYRARNLEKMTEYEQLNSLATEGSSYRVG